MKIYYRIKNNAVEIVRCFGAGSTVQIPETIEGMPVRSAAPYAFSSHFEEPLTEINVWKSQDLFEFGNREEKFLAGNEVEEIIFPDSLREIGRYIFYGCANLKKLEFSDSLLQIGCGAFTGCHGLEKLTVHMKQGLKTSVKEMLGEMWQRIDVDFLYEKEGETPWKTKLVFPEHYDEAVENTPARILYTEYHGSGSNYRQCFYNKEINYQEYDRLFEIAVVMDKLEVLIDMCFGRLEYPHELTEAARKQYVAYMKENLPEIGAYLAETGNLHRLEVLSEEKIWTREGIDAALDRAAQKRETEIAAFLMNERICLDENTDKNTSTDISSLKKYTAASHGYNEKKYKEEMISEEKENQKPHQQENAGTVRRKRRFQL